MSWGDIINCVGQTAAAANDRAVPQHVSEQAAAFYSARLLYEAYNASKTGEGDAEGRSNASAVLGALDRSLLAASQAEVARHQQKGPAGSTPPGASEEQQLAFPCRRFLFGQCPKKDKCTFRHGCPLCPTTGAASFRCFLGHLEQNGRELVRRQGGGPDPRERPRERPRSPRAGGQGTRGRGRG